jgi:hypothetical protein
MVKEIGVEYFSTPSIYSIEVANGKEKIVDIENVFKDVPMQAICFKLFHNARMISSYAMNYPIDDRGWSFEDLQLKSTDNYYLKLEVSTGGVEVLAKKGYGVLFLNHKGIVNTLMEFHSAIQDYIEELVQEDSSYKELLRIVDFTTYNSSEGLDTITIEFLQKNRDFFAKYLE